MTPSRNDSTLDPNADDAVPPEGTVSFTPSSDGKSASSDRTAFTQKLRAFGANSSRYVFLSEIGRGGMGVVHRAFDRVTRRRLAVKRILADASAASTIPARGSDPNPTSFGRFVAEAQLTAQLDHPGIVPVHEIGLDEHDNVFFAMKLVEGEDLRTIFDKVRVGVDDWNLPRAVLVLQKVCEAMAFAHSKGVVHRDLKPGNVMVGRFGEVFVMDWGLARVIAERHGATRSSGDDSPAIPPVATEGSKIESTATPALTLEGDVLGTPAYMPPEQAEGRQGEITGQTDVYAVGAMLYHLLAGEMPYGDLNGARGSPRTLLAAALSGPPTPLADLAPAAPPPLVAICEKAMAREKDERYASMEALGSDLRAWLEQRVVSAYRTGAIAEFALWTRRNRALSSTLAAALVVIAALGTASYNGIRAQRNKALASAYDADIERGKVLRLADVKRLDQLVAREKALWPARPAIVNDLGEWIADAKNLVSRLPLHRATLESLREGALPYTPADAESDRTNHPAAATLHRVELQRGSFLAARLTDPQEAARRDAAVAKMDEYLAELRAATSVRRTWRFTDVERQWQHDVLAELIDRIAVLETSDDAALHGVTIRAMEMRRESAASIQRRSIDDHLDGWNEAIAAIAGDSRFHGLRLAPQIGLIPLGRDPDSKLFEFADSETGKPPPRDAGGRLVIDDDSALVFVLLPGGTFLMGSQSHDPGAPNYDSDASSTSADSEGNPVHVALDPFFISKYEMTQGQWLRVTGTNPAYYPAGTSRGGRRVTLRNPVEAVSWLDCTSVARRLGFLLPTEAQWEYAARAGTSTRYSTGDDVGSLNGYANIADATAAREQPEWRFDPEVDDGNVIHAAVGSFKPNAFGLHDTIGNVFEWCRDSECDYAQPPQPGDGERVKTDDSERVIRGGSFSYSAIYAKSAARDHVNPTSQASHTGYRPSRAITQ